LLLNIQQAVFQLYSGREQVQQYLITTFVYRNKGGMDQPGKAFDYHWKSLEIWEETKKNSLL
jgi:hypothetical protein